MFTPTVGSATLITLKPAETVVLFDGTCKLCNGWARFIIQHDAAHRIRLATVQSEQGQAFLAWAGLPRHAFNTIVLVAGDRFYVRSEAMFQIVKRLPWYWRWVVVARLIPGPFRDWLYNKIAMNRYRIFGKYSSCRTPVADHKYRFLS
jgi:predicted DCC family thiol-disulfide oxidoreductase YuxK